MSFYLFALWVINYLVCKSMKLNRLENAHMNTTSGIDFDTEDKYREDYDRYLININ